MPRICASNNDPHDFCWHCFPDEESAREEFGDVGEGPDGRGDCFEHNAEHPDYDDFGMDYICEDCGSPLGSNDNDPA